MTGEQGFPEVGDRPPTGVGRASEASRSFLENPQETERIIRSLTVAALNAVIPLQHEGILPVVGLGFAFPVTETGKGNERSKADVLRETPDRTSVPRPAQRKDVPPLKPGEFAREAQGVIAAIDTEHKGYVTKDQLDRALGDPRFHGRQAQALLALYQQFDQLSQLTTHEGSPPRITAQDLQRFDAIQAAYHQRADEYRKITEWAVRNLTGTLTARVDGLLTTT